MDRKSTIFYILIFFVTHNIFGQYSLTYVQQGFQPKVWMNSCGNVGLFPDVWSSRIGCEYPEDSKVEHLYSAGLWIGALVDTVLDGRSYTLKFVTTVDDYDSTTHEYIEDIFSEVIPVNSSHSWYSTSIFNENEPNKRGIDDDNDGKIDEDELDGSDNDNDGKIDEDYAAISESDYYCGYTDTIPPGIRPVHTPLGIKVWQRSYAWARTVRHPIIPIEYSIVNLGKRTMRNVYIGISIFADISLGPWSSSGLWSRKKNIVGFWKELMTVFVHNPVDRWATPIGFSILSLPRQLSEGNFRFRWFDGGLFHDSIYLLRDTIRYDWLAGIKPQGLPAIQADKPEDEPGIVHVLLSFGPIEDWAVGETLKVSFAIICAQNLRYGSDNLYDNARFAQTLYARNFNPPLVTPSPKLRLEPGFRTITLDWRWDGGGINPEEVWDDPNQLVKLYPEDHWRRINPPAGHTKGGRIFEGYRLYRSEDPGGTASSFVMLKQWDIKDGIGPEFGYDTGLEYEYVDSNLHTGKTYWYSVTSYGIPDVQKMEYVDWDGSIKETMLESEGKESSVLGSRKRVRLPFSVSHELGKVLVVPNPYRVDNNYTLEFGGYEGRSRSWDENKRILKFTHLPPKCTIRIFTIGGDIVATLHHENQTIGEYDWNMLSESNRTIASGVYVFTVESEYGTQTGKFVVIR